MTGNSKHGKHGSQSHQVPHLQLRFPEHRVPWRKPPNLLLSDGPYLTPPNPWRGRPSLAALTLDLPPIIPGSPIIQLPMATRGSTGFTLGELEALVRRPLGALQWIPLGPASAQLDPRLLELLRNPSMLQRPTPSAPTSLSMRDDMKVDFGVNLAKDLSTPFTKWSSYNVEFFVAMVLQADAKQFRDGYFGKRTGLDLLHQPAGTLTLGLPTARGGSSYVAANLALTLLDFHVFRNHSTKDLFELGLGQTGINLQDDGIVQKYSVQEGINLEWHATDERSIIVTAGFNLTIDRNGLGTTPSPFINLTFVRHGGYIDRKPEGAR
jgi:hypothetical protein